MPAKRKTIPDQPVQEQLPAPATPFECCGLREDNPRDFLAALGLLRLLDMAFTPQEVALSWSSSGHPVYHSSSPLPSAWPAALCEELKRLNSESPQPFVHHKVIKVSQADFRIAVQRAVARAERPGPFSDLPSMLYAAYASQIHDLEEGKTSTSAFSFSNGQGGKELLRDISEMIARELSPDGLIRDLMGDPSARRDAKSFRWHPAEFRSAAYRAADPGAGVKGDSMLDYPSANILAFFGLPFYPVVDRIYTWETCGISERSIGGIREESFSWPVWETTLRPDTLTSLLHLPQLHASNEQCVDIRHSGCSRAWRSRRFSSDKSLYFSPAIRAL